MNRRTFQRLITAGSLGLVARGLLAANPTAEEPLDGNPPSPQPHFDSVPGTFNANSSSWKALRRAFPLRKNRVYLNAATHGPATQAALDAARYASHESAQSGELPGRDQARDRLARFLNVPAETLALTANTTQGINIIASGLRLSRGDEVILSTHEHVGGALPWLNRARLDGIVLRAFEPATSGVQNLERIEALVSPRTRVLAVPHINCTTGVRLPVEQIARFGRDRGFFVFIDGAHGPGSLTLDLEQIGAHAYAGCGHKWMLGPLGTGFLHLLSEGLEVVEAIQVGAYSDTAWTLSETEQQMGGLVAGARRFDYGTRDDAAYIGLAAAADFLDAIGMSQVEARIAYLAARLGDGLRNLPQIEVFTPQAADSRAGIVTFKHRDTDATQLDRYLRKAGFRLRRVHEADLDAVRASPHIYNSEDEIDELSDQVARY